MTVARRGLGRRVQGQRGTGWALTGTLVLHGAVGFLMFAQPRVAPRVAPIYSVHLIAAPAPAPEERRAPEVVERPAEPPPPAIKKEPPKRRTSISKETPPPPPDRTVKREPAPRTTPREQPAPGVKPSTGSDVATVSVTGVTFPFPEYLRNIVSEVYRRWHRPLGNSPLQAEVLFFIHRDGSIGDLQFIHRSGNFAFDLEAQGAIEAAGNSRAFGQLPEGYEADVLPVSFFFNPGAVR